MVEKRGNELGVRATFDKRYITLAPVAGVVGLVGGPACSSLPSSHRLPTDYPADSPSH